MIKTQWLCKLNSTLKSHFFISIYLIMNHSFSIENLVEIINHVIPAYNNQTVTKKFYTVVPVPLWHLILTYFYKVLFGTNLESNISTKE